MPVHVGIDESEDDGLVAHQCLVVALAVGNGLLVGTTVLHLPENARWLPVLVALLLDGLNPIVGDVHGHAVVEAVAAVLKLGSQSRHSRNFLGNGDGILVHLVDEQVGQRQVADGVVVLMTVEIVSIVAECLSQTVTVVEHRGHTVEAEAVEVELLQPVLAVGEQEVDDVVLAIVEAERIPCGMLVAVAGIEELIGISTEITKTLHLVLHGM